MLTGSTAWLFDHAMQRFRGELEPACRVLVADGSTVSCGLDLPDVRLVIHRRAPSGRLPEYEDAVGLAGRDRQPAAAITLVTRAKRGPAATPPSLTQLLERGGCLRAQLNAAIDPVSAGHHDGHLSASDDATGCPACDALLDGLGSYRGAFRNALADARSHLGPGTAAPVWPTLTVPDAAVPSPDPSPATPTPTVAPTAPGPRLTHHPIAGPPPPFLPARARAKWRSRGLAAARPVARITTRLARAIGRSRIFRTAIVLAGICLAAYAVGQWLDRHERTAAELLRDRLVAKRLDAKYLEPAVVRLKRDTVAVGLWRACASRIDDPGAVSTLRRCIIVAPENTDRQILGTFNLTPGGRGRSCTGAARRLIQGCEKATARAERASEAR